MMQQNTSRLPRDKTPDSLTPASKLKIANDLIRGCWKESKDIASGANTSQAKHYHGRSSAL